MAGGCLAGFGGEREEAKENCAGEAVGAALERSCGCTMYKLKKPVDGRPGLKHREALTEFACRGCGCAGVLDPETMDAKLTEDPASEHDAAFLALLSAALVASAVLCRQDAKEG